MKAIKPIPLYGSDGTAGSGYERLEKVILHRNLSVKSSMVAMVCACVFNGFAVQISTLQNTLFCANVHAGKMRVN